MVKPACSRMIAYQVRLAVLFLALFGLGLWDTAADTQAASEVNLALGKKVTLSPAPTYAKCADPDDRVQLTDGRLVEGYFWVQRGCVGWTSELGVSITVDLGRIEPISGVSFRTAAGSAGVSWPAEIRIAVSDDGKQYRDVGDLVAIDRDKRGKWPEGYAVRRLATHDLATRGRFVEWRVVPADNGFVFCDEVEVFCGPDALLQADPGGKPVGNMTDWLVRRKLVGAIRRRYTSDLTSLRHAIDQAAGVNASVKRSLLAQAAEVGAKLESTPIEVDRSFRAILPYSDDHAKVFALQAALWKAGGHPALAAWVPNTWDPVPLFATPGGGSQKIEVHAMRGEYRAAALNLANATDSPKSVRLHFEGLPNLPTPDYLTVAEVPWTDTAKGQPVAAALPEVRPEVDGWPITVLPGMVRQAWMTVHTTEVPPGTHSGTAVVTSNGERPLRIPFELYVYPAALPKKTTLLLGGWSYTNTKVAYGITARNRDALVRHLQDRFVNAPWATGTVMLKFDVVDDDRVKLDTREFDEWIAQWPEAKQYMVFLSVAGNAGSKRTFRETKVGAPEFRRLVAAWISAWVEHLRTKGIEPARLGLLIHDEPYDTADVAPLVAWARAIHAAEPDVRIWNDPTYRQPAQAPPALFETSSVLCPNRPMWLVQGKPFAEFYLDQQRRGRTLQFYSCSGPARLLDPYSYYRLQAWHCWKIGATGSFFWAFGDNGGASSWDEYLANRGPCTPLFIDDTSVTAGKQMEAIRESVEDYETFVMLRAAVDRAKAAGRSDAAVAKAETLLKTAADAVLDAGDAGPIRWETPRDRTLADSVRAGLLQSLTTLGAGAK